MNALDLSGSWYYETDEADIGIAENYYNKTLEKGGFVLPGSACQNQVGKKQEYYDTFSREAIRAPREKYEYIGPLWLQKEIEVPQEAAGKAIYFSMERVNVASDLWVDGEKIGRQIIELSAPHTYDLTGRLEPGIHRITLRLDNRDLVSLDNMSSGYSIDTQGYWNGAIGTIRLWWEEICHIASIQIYPEESGIAVHVTEASDCHYAKRRSAELTLTVTDPDGKELESKTYANVMFNSRQVEHLRYGMEAIRWWDEFSPDLYRLTVTMRVEGRVTDRKTQVFGMRLIRSDDGKFLLNGKQISLRGTTDCAIHPLTGYPPMDLETWKKKLSIVKEYGLNYVRFHAWCPPESAFAAADELGVYLSVEMPFWLNKDVCRLEAGDDPIHRTYFTQEAITISKTYGNHPSFLLFSNGNEIMGDFELLEDITVLMKGYDKRRLYTLTSNFDHPVAPCEDYFCAFEADGHRTRNQTLQDLVAESTCLDFKEAVEAIPVPVVSFEVGQYCIYPDVDLIPRYTGNMLPVNLDVIQKSMEKNGIRSRLDMYKKASGKLAARLYKEDLESALRTRNLGGISLLALTDYTGQSTAMVGILDVFWESKKILEPEEFRRFCGPVVPLWKAKRIFSNRETLEAELDLYDFGKEPIRDPLFHLVIRDGDRIFYETETKERRISISLSSIQRSALLTVTLMVGEYRNDWRIFAFAEPEEKKELTVLRGNSPELKEMIENGGRALVGKEGLHHPIPGSFVPVFWSPVHFPTSQPCGARIDADHEALAAFPTDDGLDFQWKSLMDHCEAADIGGFGEAFHPIVEMVPNFVDNRPSTPLFAAKVGKAEILYCGFDLDREDPATKQMRESLADYLAHGSWEKEAQVEPEKFLELFQA